MQILHRQINTLVPPYIVADISGNHDQNFQKALKLIKATKDAGCDAVKFQTYTPEKLSVTGSEIKYNGRDLLELYNSICLLPEWYGELNAYAKSINLTAFTTVFYPDDVQLLEESGCPAYKISSYEIRHIDLINAVRETGKPVMISTGCASFSDLTFISSRFSALNTAFLRCVSKYPAPPEDFNLATIRNMRSEFGMEIGLSDHSMGSAIACVAVAMGASIVEKHITMSKDSIDGSFALMPDEMKRFVEDINTAWLSVGEVDYSTPIKDRKYMPSLHAIKNIKSGELFTRENLAVIRPNDGMDSTQLYNFLGKRASEDILKNTAIHLRHIK